MDNKPVFEAHYTHMHMFVYRLNDEIMSATHTVPVSEGFSPQSPESVLSLLGNDGSNSDFGRTEGISPLCLQSQGEETCFTSAASSLIVQNV